MTKKVIKKVAVQAVRTGFYAGARRKPGSVFFVKDTEITDKKNPWFVPVDQDDKKAVKKADDAKAADEKEAAEDAKAAEEKAEQEAVEKAEKEALAKAKATADKKASASKKSEPSTEGSDADAAY